MSKKGSNQRRRAQRGTLIFKRRKLVAGLLGLVVSLAGTGLAYWTISRANVPPLATTTSEPLALSKEYIYAGDRLIATEEPVSSGGNVLPAPGSLTATTISDSQINLTWAPSTGDVDHYQVERSQSIAGPYIRLTPDPRTNVFYDTSVSNGAAYLYRVHAVDARGNVSPDSNTDLATAINFTDEPLVTGVTAIKAQHLIELRHAVDAVRLTAGLPAALWSDGVQSGGIIKALHVRELRDNLNQALTAIGLSPGSYTDLNLSSNVSIKAEHIRELRQQVK
jgi:Fibronectin type III domain